MSDLVIHIMTLIYLIFISMLFLALLVILFKTLSKNKASKFSILPRIKVQIMISFVLICNTVTSWMLTIAEMYAVASISDTGSHEYLDDEITIGLQSLSACTFVMAQLVMIYFFIHRLETTLIHFLDPNAPVFVNHGRRCILFIIFLFINTTH